jgi:hypothetical protein
MSEAKTEIPQLSIVDQLKLQHSQFVQQKEIAQNNLNQLIGAIYACDIMIKRHEEEAAKQLAGGQGNGETDEQATEKASQE